MRTLNEIRERATRLGLLVGVSAPGDGARRYSFEWIRYDSTEPMRVVGRAVGAASAMLWLEGYAAGMEYGR